MELPEKIQQLHETYCRLVPKHAVRLTMGTERQWYDCVRDGMDAEELELAIRFINHENKKAGRDYQRSLILHNLIGDYDKISKLVSFAQGMRTIDRKRAASVPTARAEALRATGRSDETMDGQTNNSPNIIPMKTATVDALKNLVLNIERTA